MNSKYSRYNTQNNIIVNLDFNACIHQAYHIYLYSSLFLFICSFSTTFGLHGYDIISVPFFLSWSTMHTHET